MDGEVPWDGRCGNGLRGFGFGFVGMGWMVVMVVVFKWGNR